MTLVWQSDASMTKWRLCGEVTPVWQSDNSVKKWQQCDEVTAVWRSDSSVTKWQQCDEVTLTRSIIINLILGSKTDLWHFGFYRPNDSGKEKVYESKAGGVPSYSDEMQLAVHDQREQPIGWSSWDPKPGEVLGTKCVRNCETGVERVLRRRYCRCLPQVFLHCQMTVSK